MRKHTLHLTITDTEYRMLLAAALHWRRKVTDYATIYPADTRLEIVESLIDKIEHAWDKAN